MKKFIFFITVICFSCTDTEKNDLKLTLLNNELICVSNLDNNLARQGLYLTDSIYEKLSRNVVKFKIENLSNKVFLIVLDQDNIYKNEESSLFNQKFSFVNGLSLNLYNDTIVNGFQYQLGHVFNKENSLYSYAMYNLYKDSLYLDNYKKKYEVSLITAKRFFTVNEKSFILYPGQIKYFSTIVNLPMLTYRNDLQWVTQIDPNLNYQAEISIINDANETASYLSTDLKKEIKENNYIILNGKIKSNRIPVRLVKYN